MKSLDELKKIRDEAKKNLELRDSEKTTRVVVGMATCGISAGARPVLQSFIEEVQKRHLNEVQVVQTGCIGMCTYEPIVEITTPDKDKVTYIHMDVDKVKRVVAEHLVHGRAVREYTIGYIK
ncbi:MAG: (2Fe-2S) ferredoxin domain-containing protein [Dethiosulfatibacter sp.]|nr:(2Fe-2S) ferredoxin domain-containing protein [Dethiosulfatibacter sp.]